MFARPLDSSRLVVFRVTLWRCVYGHVYLLLLLDERTSFAVCHRLQRFQRLDTAPIHTEQIMRLHALHHRGEHWLPCPEVATNTDLHLSLLLGRVIPLSLLAQAAPQQDNLFGQSA